jgi:hypothetical protein
MKSLIPNFFYYEIHNHKDALEKECKDTCFMNLPLFTCLCEYMIHDKLSMYSNHVENNPFIHPVIKKFTLLFYCNAVQKQTRLKKLFTRYIRKRRRSYCTTDLALNPLTEIDPKYCIDIMHDYKKYTFKLFDLTNIIFNSLTNSDEHFFSSPLPIKNPYTNIKFSPSILYIIYFCLQQRGLPIHPLFTLFMKENFNLGLFALKHEGIIKDYIIDTTVKKFNTRKTIVELQSMFQELTVYNVITMTMDVLMPNVNTIPDDVLIHFKPLLYHYMHSLYSLTSYYRQLEYNKLIKKIIAFKKENPIFIITHKITVPITKVNYKEVVIPRRSSTIWESLMIIP